MENKSLSRKICNLRLFFRGELPDLLRPVFREIVCDELDAHHRRQEVPALLERDETAEALRISQRKLSTLTAAGEISHIRVGRRVLYSAEALRAYVRRRAEEGRK